VQEHADNCTSKYDAQQQVLQEVWKEEAQSLLVESVLQKILECLDVFLFSATKQVWLTNLLLNDEGWVQAKWQAGHNVK